MEKLIYWSKGITLIILLASFVSKNLKKGRSFTCDPLLKDMGASTEPILWCNGAVRNGPPETVTPRRYTIKSTVAATGIEKKEKTVKVTRIPELATVPWTPHMHNR